MVGAVETEDLTEISGLGASRRHDGVLWAHNDSGHVAAISAVGVDGRHLGTYPIPDVPGIDIEDLAVVDGTIHLADIGDNDVVRDAVYVYLVPEPDPFTVPDGTPVDGVEIVEVRYRTGPRDAEAFLVDPIDGQWIVIEKSFAIGGGAGLLRPTAARVATAPAPAAGEGGSVELVDRGLVALDMLTSSATGPVPPDALFTELGIAGVATGADVAEDGTAIVVRTYQSLWLFERPTGTSVVDALASVPCELPSGLEEQGEAVAFEAAPGRGVITISEGRNPPIHRTEIPPG